MSFWKYQQGRLGVSLNILGGDWTNLYSKGKEPQGEQRDREIEDCLRFVADYYGYDVKKRVSDSQPDGFKDHVSEGHESD